MLNLTKIVLSAQVVAKFTFQTTGYVVQTEFLPSRCKLTTLIGPLWVLS